jgi:hypothetical protein
MTSVSIQVEVFWDMIPCSVSVGYQRLLPPSSLHPEDVGTILLRYVGILPQHYTASQSRRPRFESSLPWRPHTSHDLSSPCSNVNKLNRNYKRSFKHLMGSLPIIGRSLRGTAMEQPQNAATTSSSIWGSILALSDMSVQTLYIHEECWTFMQLLQISGHVICSAPVIVD